MIFKVGASTAISDIEAADEEIVSTRIITPQGVTVLQQEGSVELTDLTLPHGLYIIEKKTRGGCYSEKVVL